MTSTPWTQFLYNSCNLGGSNLFSTEIRIPDATTRMFSIVGCDQLVASFWSIQAKFRKCSHQKLNLLFLLSQNSKFSHAVHWLLTFHRYFLVYVCSFDVASSKINSNCVWCHYIIESSDVEYFAWV